MTYKIGWHSNAPWAPSGYGNQSGLFTSLMDKDPDFEVTFSAFWGMRGAQTQIGGMKVLPGSRHPYGADVMAARWDVIKADAFVVLADIWVFDRSILKSRPFTCWVPVDHHPIPPMVADKLSSPESIWAMSKHGFQQMKNVGINPYYVPHGVNTDVYKPIDRTEARQRFKLDDDTFFIVTVAANTDGGDRKNLRGMLIAFSRFVSEHPNALFYMHTNPQASDEGIDLKQMVETLQIEDKVIFPDQYAMLSGLYPENVMNKLYNAADVFLLPSAGEGFGIPVLEAQASGCPVIVNDFTAQSELCGAGYKIRIDVDDLDYTLQQSFRARVRVSKIIDALKLSIEWKDDEALRKQAREFAVTYDYRKVYSDFMKPAIIDQIEKRHRLESIRKSNTEKRLQIRAKAQKVAEKVETDEVIHS